MAQAAGSARRDQGRRPAQLSREQIVDAALRIIQRGGVEALSMRRLSRELGVSPMATYYYVADKNGLLDLVAEAVLSAVPVPGPDAGPWDVRLRMLIDGIDAELRAHPGLGDVLLAEILSAQRTLLDAVMELLFEAGFDAQDVILAYAALYTYLFGRHKVTLVTPDAYPGEPPAPAWMAPHLAALTGRDFYTFGVETMIEGLRARLHVRKGDGAGPSAGGAGA